MHVQKIWWIMSWIIEESGTRLERVDRHVRGCKTWSQGCASVYLLHIILPDPPLEETINNHMIIIQIINLIIIIILCLSAPHHPGPCPTHPLRKKSLLCMVWSYRKCTGDQTQDSSRVWDWADQIMAKTPGLVGRVEFRATSILCIRVNSFIWLEGVPSSKIHGTFFYIFCGTQISADKGNELAGTGRSWWNWSCIRGEVVALCCLCGRNSQIVTTAISNKQTFWMMKGAFHFPAINLEW